MKSHYLYIILVFIFFNCTDEISLDTDFEPHIFISGIITNESRHVTITVQKSIPVKSTTPVFINNAVISLYSKEKNGNTSLITNEFSVENGMYTSTKIINTIIGNYYWIEVELTDGTIFKSSEEELLKPSIPINSITTENYVTKVSFSDPANDTNFYRLVIIFDLGGGQSDQIYKLSNDVLFNGNDNAFIETDTPLNNGIHAILANLNFDTYQFYLNLQEQEYTIEGYDDDDENIGDPSQLFASPPVNLIGNILNTSTNRKALGNFGVVSISYYSN